MTSRWFRRYSAGDDELRSREANDRRLRQAISYVQNEGGSDAAAAYVNRVQKIDDDVLKQYREEGYSFDPKLYRNLRSLVQEVQSDFQRVTEEESSVDLADSDASIEELLSTPAALYRRPSGDADFGVPPTRRNAQSSTSPPQRLRKADVRETQFLYGGPNNEVEEWHKDFPSALPFGENLYMQEWESMKINHDLTKYAKKSADDPDLIIRTNVPYHAVGSNFSEKDVYDSGSRFKLPNIAEGVWNQIKKVAKYLPFASVAEDFNQGGVLQHQVEKDYAPRVFLPQVSTSARRASHSRPHGIGKSAKAKGKEPTRRPSLPPTVAGPSKPCTPAKTSRAGTINPEVLSQIRKHPQRASTFDDIDFGIDSRPFTPSLPKPNPKATPKTPKSTLKKFDQRRAAVSKPSATPSSTRAKTGATTRTRTPSITDPITDEPVTRRLSHIVAGPSAKRGPGRPPKSTATVSAPSPPATRSAKGKRKLDDVDDSYTEATKKPKVSKKTPAKTPAKKESVAFVDKATSPAPKPSAKKTVTAKKPALKTPTTRATSVKKPAVKPSPAKKPAAKTAGVKKAAPKRRASREVLPVSELLTVPRRSAAGYEKVKRGVTRSGTKFKGRA